MKIRCPVCHVVVPPDGVNMPRWTAFCPRCNEAFVIPEDLRQPPETETDTAPPEPPRGAWMRQDYEGVVVGASTRSPAAFFLVPFTCVWSGFSLGGIYGTQILAGKFNLLLSLFGIVFVLGSIMLVSMCAMTVAGKVVVTIRHGEGVVFTGVGPFGRHRRFDWTGVARVNEVWTREGSPGGDGGAVSLEGATRLHFGGMLNAERRYFVVRALRYLKSGGGP